MNLLANEWVQKAEDDFIVAQRELRARKSPVFDAVCFHSQQCAEKYLKAFLQDKGIAVPKTHQLLDLLKLCKESDPSFDLALIDINIIEPFAVNIRYPGIRANKEEAQIVFKAVQRLRQFIRQRLGVTS
jgi:HEPN domain-containing protein